MSDIQRYDVDDYYGRYKREDGPYVLYEDPLAVVKALENKIAELENRAMEEYVRGFTFGLSASSLPE